MLIKVSKIVLLIILTELCLGGGGRLTAVGPVSLRMILFGLAMALTVLMLIKNKTIKPLYWKILVIFFLVILVGGIIGMINHSQLHLLREDIKPLLYFLILPFFALTIERKETIDYSRIVKVSSLVLAGLFFIMLILIHTKALPFLTFYRLTEKTEEFFYRGELSFFYKGFLFLGIGSVFYYFDESRKKYLLISVLIAAIFFSVTRGLIFSLATTFIIYYITKKNYLKAIGIVTIAIAVVVWGNQGTIKLSQWLDSIRKEKSISESNPHLFGVRNYSDQGRAAQIKEVTERISMSSIFFGHGFGQGTPSRPVHMEIAYLEVFHKQGLVGLAFWGILAGMILKTYLRSDRSSLANSFFYSSIFVFVQSVTNQYFNNPIGMSVLLLSLVCLDKLRNPS